MQPNHRFSYINFMFGLHDSRFRDILLLTIGFCCVLWFFFDFGHHHPLSTMEVHFSDDEVVQMADSLFLNFEYQPVHLKKRASIKSNSVLINKIQEFYGREKYLTNSDADNHNLLPLHTWLVEEFSVSGDEANTAVTFELSNTGEVVSFSVSDEILEEQKPFSRKTISQLLGRHGTYDQQQEDSVIAKLLDFQHLRSRPFDLYRLILRNAEDGEGNFIWRGVDDFLKNSYWRRFEFHKDSLSLEEDAVVRFAKLHLTSKDTVMGVVPKLEIEMLPAGVIRKVSFELSNNIPASSQTSRIRVNIILGILFLVFVWMLISFYLRIKARAIDTRPALIVAVITGFMVPFFFLLELLKSYDVSFVPQQLSIVFNRILGYGVFGALAAILFFVATAVSDSITRQYWPEQLKTWDLIRQGMFKNKPVGWVLVRAVCMGSLASGVFSLLFHLFPEVYISGEVGFIGNYFVLAPIANIISNLLLGLAIVVLTFMILGNQLYSISSRKWSIPILSGVVFAIVEPLSLTIFPEVQGMLIQGIIGVVFGIFYIYFDFLSVALGFFIFLNFIVSAKGWVVANSPDAPVFYGFLLLLIFLSGLGCYFLLVGDEKDSLPEYIPEYIEEQAKEQRIMQELDIARNVQLAFLPTKTPDVPGFDTSAICIPAQETGGDYYDIICLDNERAAIAIGDVSGKGIQAAFYMTFTKGVIHSLCSVFPSPKMLMYRTNKLFNENATRGTFISMIYGVLDLKTHTFTYVRAGHNPILLKRANGTIEWLQPKGVALGMAKGEQFNKVVEEQEVHLEKGDFVVLYTDGITEAQNENEEFYDESRLKKLIKRAKTDSAEELRNLIIEDVRNFAGNALQFDDMTLVVIKA